MRHLIEDELILMHYGEIHDAALDAHLQSCADCQSEAAALRRVFDALALELVPERGEEYAAEVWTRVRWQFGSSAAQRTPRRRLLATAAALLVTGFIGGRYLFNARDHATDLNGPAATNQLASQAVSASNLSSENSGNAALDFAAGEHIEDSTRFLLDLNNRREGDAVASPSSNEGARDLVVANRLYRQAAATAGASELADVLEQIEPILLELVHGPEELSPDELTAIQTRIESGELLFKLRVIASNIREQQKVRRDSVRIPKSPRDL